MRLFAAAAPVFFGCMAWFSASVPFVEQELLSWLGLVAVWGFLTLLMIWLFFRSAILVYTVREEGLEIRRWRKARMIPWEQITSITWNRWLRYFTLRGGMEVVSFTSTDGFPRPGELLKLIHERSGCVIPE